MSAATLRNAAATTPWQLDAAHTGVEFAVRHMMVSTVRGRFKTVEGTISGDLDDPSSLRLEVRIPVASLDTGVEQRDAHLRSPDFFNVESHHAMTFRSRRVEGDLKGDFRLIGDLTIRGVTREVALDVTTEGRARDPWGNERAGFTARGKINRQDFGLTWNALLETGGVVVGDEVKIAIDVELMRPLAATAAAAAAAAA